MTIRTPIVLLLALAACGTQPTEPTASSSPDGDPVLALSRTAVESAPGSNSEREEGPGIDTGSAAAEEPGPEQVALTGSLMEDAVPIESSEPEEPEERVEEEPGPELASFTLRRGETLHHFARWSGFPVEDLATFSSLDLDGSYPVGTEVSMPLEGEALAEVEKAREDHWDRRIEGYLASRGGAVDTEFYQVRTGDSLWGIARHRYGMPTWVIESYNPSMDLDRLRPGQELMVPVLADTVVDAGSEEPEEIPAGSDDSESISEEAATVSEEGATE